MKINKKTPNTYLWPLYTHKWANGGSFITCAHIHRAYISVLQRYNYIYKLYGLNFVCGIQQKLKP